METSNYIPGCVRIVNLTSSEMDPVFRGGHSVHLMPFKKEWTSHISEPILKKYLTDKIRSMKAKGIIDIVEVTE